MLTNTTLNHSADTKRFTSQLRYIIAALLLILIATAIIWPNASAAGNEAGSHIYPSAANGPGAVTSHVPPPIGAQGMPPAAINPQTPSDDATLSALTVSPRDIIGFDAGQDYYEVGFASTVDRSHRHGHALPIQAASVADNARRRWLRRRPPGKPFRRPQHRHDHRHGRRTCSHLRGLYPQPQPGGYRHLRMEGVGGL